VRDDRLYALWLLVATTGMRRAELAGLRWSDIDFARARLTRRLPRVVVNYQVHESDTKTASGRRIKGSACARRRPFRAWPVQWRPAVCLRSGCRIGGAGALQ
jgi:integrase